MTDLTGQQLDYLERCASRSWPADVLIASEEAPVNRTDLETLVREIRRRRMERAADDHLLADALRAGWRAGVAAAHGEVWPGPDAVDVDRVERAIYAELAADQTELEPKEGVARLYRVIASLAARTALAEMGRMWLEAASGPVDRPGSPALPKEST